MNNSEFKDLVAAAWHEVSNCDVVKNVQARAKELIKNHTGEDAVCDDVGSGICDSGNNLSKLTPVFAVVVDGCFQSAFTTRLEAEIMSYTNDGVEIIEGTFTPK